MIETYYETFSKDQMIWMQCLQCKEEFPVGYDARLSVLNDLAKTHEKTCERKPV